MGVIKKLFGIGSTTAAASVDTTPVTTAVTNADVSLDNDTEASAQKKKKGARSLAVANDTGASIVGGAGAADKRTVTGAG